MTSKQSTRRALFSSVISLILCCAMLIGTTFAWFTDSVASGNNKIIAGSLQVGLEMFDGTNYVDIGETSTPIFGAEDSLIAQNNNADTLWEPGKTKVAYLKIVNKGTLSLKYRVDIKVTNDAKDLYEAKTLL